jgi:hypothetical protein
VKGGYGAEILVSGSPNEDALTTLVKGLAAKHDPVLIRVFSSRAAYDAEKNEKYGKAYSTGYLLFYVKNLTGSGPYGGRNEIRWMQETGQLESLFGETTKMR